MTKKAFNYVSDFIEQVRVLQSEMQKVIGYQQELTMNQGQQVVGGGIRPIPSLSVVSPDTPPAISVPQPPNVISDIPADATQSPFAPLTNQQHFALDLGMPMDSGITTHSDLAQARIAELTLGSQSRQEAMTATGAQLREGGTGIDIETASKLEDINRQWTSLSNKVREISDSMTSMDKASKEYAKAVEELTKATKDETRTREQLQQLEEEAKEILRQRGGGGGGGGGQPPWWQNQGFQANAQWANVAGQAIGTAGELYGAYGNMYQAGARTDLNAELTMAQQTGQMEAIRARRMFGAMDLTQGSNLVRYFGDFATGDADRYSYLGVGAAGDGRELADQLAEREYRYQERGLGFQMMGGFARMGGGALSLPSAILSGGAMGAGIGALAGGAAIPGALIGATIGLARGISNLGQQGSSIGSAYATNPYALSEGGLAGTGVGSLMYGDQSNAMASRAFGRYWLGRELTETQYVEQLRNAEQQSRQAQEDIRGYDEMQSAIRARQAYAPMVGRFATSGLPSVSSDIRAEQVGLDIYSTGVQENLQNVQSRLGFQTYSNIYNELGISPREEIDLSTIRGRNYIPSDRKGAIQQTLTSGSIANIIGQVQRSGDLNTQLQTLQQLRGQLTGAPSYEMERIEPYLNRLEANLTEAVGEPVSSAAALQQRAEEAAENLLEPNREQAEFLGSMELSFSDWARRQNLATSMIFGGRASSGLTTDLIRMGRSGLGSEQQIAQNVMQLQQVSGRQEDLSELKDIMAEAVSIGFNKSQMAQQFVQATVNLASSLRTTATDTIAEDLAIGARVFGAGGEASLLGLQGAQQGISALGQYTGQTGGITGSLKSFAAFEGGMTLGGGSSLALGMNVYQLGQARQSLETGNFSDPRTENLIRAAAMEQFGISNLSELTEEQRSAIGNQLTRVQEASLAPIRANINQQTGSATGFQDLVDRARTAAEQGDMDEYRSILAMASSYGESTQLGGAGTMTAIMQEAGTGRLRPGDVNRVLEEQINAGNANFTNPQNQARQAFINRLTASMSGRFYSAAPSRMVGEYFERGGEALAVRGYNEEGELTQQEITSMEQYEKLPTNMRQQIQNSDLVRGLQSQIASTEQGYDQGVDYISNRALNSLQEIILQALVMSKNMDTTDTSRFMKGLFGG